MKDIFEFARKTISDVNEKDYKNMPIIYDNSSNNEKV